MPQYLINVKHFNKFAPVVSVPIHPKAELYREGYNVVNLELNAQPPHFSWNVGRYVDGAVYFEFVGDDSYYTPREEDVGSVLELTVTIVLHGGGSVCDKVCTSTVLSRSYLPQWFSRTLKMVNGVDVHRQYDSNVLIYTYNVMADTYVKEASSVGLNWIHRMDNATLEIKTLNPDIILLQEVEEHALNVKFKEQHPNYTFFYKSKVNRGWINHNAFLPDEEGVCIGVRKATFSISQSDLIDFDSFWQSFGSNSQLDERVYNKPNVSIVLVLEEINTKKKIIIANVHFSSLEKRARMFQVSSLFHHIKSLHDYGLNTTIIVGGDFNADPNRDVLAALKAGTVKQNDPHSTYSELSKVFPLKFPKMLSAYAEIVPSEKKRKLLYRYNNNEPYTFSSKMKKSTTTRDYVMFRNGACVEALQMLSKEDLLLSTLPSDHISLAAKLKY